MCHERSALLPLTDHERQPNLTTTTSLPTTPENSQRLRPSGLLAPASPTGSPKHYFTPIYHDVPRNALARVFPPPKRLARPPRPNLRALLESNPNPHALPSNIRFYIDRRARRPRTPSSIAPSQPSLQQPERRRARDAVEYSDAPTVVRTEVLE